MSSLIKSDAPDVVPNTVVNGPWNVHDSASHGLREKVYRYAQYRTGWRGKKEGVQLVLVQIKAGGGEWNRESTSVAREKMCCVIFVVCGLLSFFSHVRLACANPLDSGGHVLGKAAIVTVGHVVRLVQRAVHDPWVVCARSGRCLLVTCLLQLAKGRHATRMTRKTPCKSAAYLFRVSSNSSPVMRPCSYFLCTNLLYHLPPIEAHLMIIRPSSKCSN